MTTYDFMIIGGGTAGYAAASRAAELGLKTAIIEDAPLLGGLCIINGCMPTKTMIESANRLRDVRLAGRFGVCLPPGEPFLDLQVVQERKERLIEDFRQFREKQLREGKFDLIRGRGRFLGPHHIEVTDCTGGSKSFRARTALIATGSRPRIPEIEGLGDVPFWVSDHVLDMREIPESIVIVGAGSVGMEVGHLFEGAGSRVTILHRHGHPLNGLHPELGESLAQASRERGIVLELDADVTRVERQGEGVRVHWERDGKASHSDGAVLLLATGRAPQLEDIGLEATGLSLRGGRLSADAATATAVPHIFAAGDASSPRPVVHLAALQGKVAAENAARVVGKSDAPPSRFRDDLLFTCIFTKPEVAQIGFTEEEARRHGFDPICASYPFADHGKALIHGTPAGFVRLVADRKTGRLLGGQAVGAEAISLIHQVMVAVAAGLTAAEYAEIPHYHPTLSEIWTYPAEEIADALAGMGG